MVVVVVAVVGLIAFAVALLVSVVFFCLFFHWSCVGCCSGCRRFIGMVVVDADVVRAVLCVVAPVGAPRKRSSRAYAGLALFCCCRGCRWCAGDATARCRSRGPRYPLKEWISRIILGVVVLSC